MHRYHALGAESRVARCLAAVSDYHGKPCDHICRAFEVPSIAIFDLAFILPSPVTSYRTLSSDRACTE